LLGASTRAVADHHSDFLVTVEDGAMRCSAKVGKLPEGKPVAFVRAGMRLMPHMAVRCGAPAVPAADDKLWLCPPILKRRGPDGEFEILAAAM